MDSDFWKEFEENDLTHSAAHHLLAILHLKQERGYARVSDVARYLSITTGSASTNLKSLRQKGLVVEDDNKFVTLSKEGEKLANAVVERRETFLKFLVEVLKVDPKQAEIDACKTEHLLSQQTCDKICDFMKASSKSKK